MMRDGRDVIERLEFWLTPGRMISIDTWGAIYDDIAAGVAEIKRLRPRPTDIVERLDQWVKLRAGEIPAFAAAEPNGWAEALNEDHKAAIAEIQHLRAKVAAK